VDATHVWWTVPGSPANEGMDGALRSAPK
jgi:hypothetical protein